MMADRTDGDYFNDFASLCFALEGPSCGWVFGLLQRWMDTEILVMMM
jgi:hypothetical protein